MATVEENLKVWTRHDWSTEGDDWSGAWGGTETMWRGSILPRIFPFLPARSILELAPGFGRCTQFLKDLCDELTVVDLTPRCIEACQARFASSTNIKYHVNDGKSLAAVPDGTIDFVFSYDSLVHVGADVMQSYVSELSRKLAPQGVGFIHHSDLGRHVDARGNLPFDNVDWRDLTMTAERFDRFCQSTGLRVILQESVNWSGEKITDCMSIFTRAGSRYDASTVRIDNPHFQTEIRRLAAVARSASGREGNAR